MSLGAGGGPVAERAALFRRLESEGFDLLVIGGGITGAGIARDAALRGLAVALVDKGDWGSGTSSRSSKLVHGGLRYLEHAEFRLVFEGTNERALLMRLAPHLVRPIQFLVPSYREDRPGLFVLDVGLWIYDALSKFSSPRLHQTLRAKRLTALEPGLITTGLKGGLLYYDCMTDDARLTLENVLDARSLGVPALNYARVTELIKEGDRVVGALVTDDLRPGAAPVAARAKVVVNATGPWSDQVRKMVGEPGVLRTTKGVHLVVDGARLPLRHAVVMKKGRRVVFCIPWGERAVIGTTDTYYEGLPEDVDADAGDVSYLLGLANAYFPEARLSSDDVLATWAGLRPLLKPPSERRSASDVSREHQIYARPGLVTVAGGKLTTYRRMAAEVVDACGPQLGGIGPCATLERPLPGAQGEPRLSDQDGVERIAQGLSSGGIELEVSRHLASTYGGRAPGLARRAAVDPTAGARLDPELPYLLGQVDVAVEEEQAVCVEDVLRRRVPLLLRGRDQGLSVASQVAARMGERLGWSAAEATRQLEDYQTQVARSRRFRQ